MLFVRASTGVPSNVFSSSHNAPPEFILFIFIFPRLLLFQACPGGKKPIKADRLRAFKQDALRDFRDGNGRSALHFAATSNAQGCDVVVRAILTVFPAAHELKDDNGATPLILAADAPGPGVAEAMVGTLLAAGADVCAADKDGVQALHHASGGGRTGAIAVLHKGGAPLDSVSAGSGTPLHWACGEGRLGAVEALVGLGASLDLPNSQGLPPVVFAAARGSGPCLAALAAAGADCGHVLSGGLTLLHVCADLGLVEGVTALVATPVGKACCARPDDKGQLPVHLAAAAGHEAVVGLLRPFLVEAAGAAGEAAVPSVAELLEQGKAAAAAEASASSEATTATAAAAAATEALVENTKPPASPEDATAAQEAKGRGNAAFAAKDFELAAKCYTEALLLDGTDAAFLSNRSACWLELAKAATKAGKGKGDGEAAAAAAASASALRARALADAERCRKLKPDWPKGCFRLASARLASGQYEDAALAAFEGLKLDDGNKELKTLMQVAVGKGREAHFRDRN